MNQDVTLSDSSIHEVGNCLIASLGSHADENSIFRTGKMILEQLKKKRPKGVIIDVSDVIIVTSKEFAILKNVARSVVVMGTPSLFSGVQPGVAAALVDLDTGFDDIATTRDINDAVEMLTKPVLD